MTARPWIALAAWLGVSWPQAACGFVQEFGTPVTPLRPGHAMLVTLSARGTELESKTWELVRGQWELDMPGIEGPRGPDDARWLNVFELLTAFANVYEPADQHRHFLRWWSGLPSFRTRTRSLREDHQASVGYVKAELALALSAEPGPEAMRHLGHALHTVQDSFSPAHTQRDDDLSIVLMRYCPDRADGGHQLPGDARDLVVDEHGQFYPEARRAIEAGRSLLVGYAQARRSGELAGFVERFCGQYLRLGRDDL